MVKQLVALWTPPVLTSRDCKKAKTVLMMPALSYTCVVVCLQVVTMHDGSAHPATSASLKKVSQLGEFFKHSLDDWLKAISRKGFISLQAVSPSAFGLVD